MGHEVTVFHRGHTEADLPPEVRHLHHPPVTPGDRRHFADFAAVFRQLAPDLVLDMIPCTEIGPQVESITWPSPKPCPRPNGCARSGERRGGKAKS